MLSAEASKLCVLLTGLKFMEENDYGVVFVESDAFMVVSKLHLMNFCLSPLVVIYAEVFL